MWERFISRLAAAAANPAMERFISRLADAAAANPAMLPLLVGTAAFGFMICVVLPWIRNLIRNLKYKRRVRDYEIARLGQMPSQSQEYVADPAWPVPAGIDEKYLLHLYRKYRGELNKVIRTARKYCQQKKAECMSDTLELELSYMRIREKKPRLLFDISPRTGYSTLFLLTALTRNGLGKVYSFDKSNISLTLLPASFISNESLYTFVHGDVRKTLPVIMATTGAPDYAYLELDSMHSTVFGRFFQQNLIEKMPPGALVSQHDVFHNEFWSDLVRGRDLVAHPPDHPTEEGAVILRWLAMSGRGKNVFTLSAGPKSPHHGWACSAREKYLAIHNTPRPGELHELDGTGCGNQNPTLFYELQ